MMADMKTEASISIQMAASLTLMATFSTNGATTNLVVTTITRTSTIPHLSSSKNNLHDTTRRAVDIRGLLVDNTPDILRTNVEAIDTMAAVAPKDLQTLLTGPVKQWPKTTIETIGEKSTERVINIINISKRMVKQ